MKHPKDDKTLDLLDALKPPESIQEPIRRRTYQTKQLKRTAARFGPLSHHSDVTLARLVVHEDVPEMQEACWRELGRRKGWLCEVEQN